MKEKFLKLMEKEGFILFLFICVCAVAGGTLFLSVRNLDTSKKKTDEEELVIIEEEKNLTERELEPIPYVENRNRNRKDVETAVLATAEDEYEEEYEMEEEEEIEDELEFIEEEEDVEDVETINDKDKVEEIALPVEGSIITDFTKDSLIYSETLESWVGHKAIDIEAKEGTVVVAAMDGVVEKVYEDELWGIVIVIDHGNQLKTRYCNLATKEMVKEGISVKKGDHISKVGQTAKIEMLMKPHLHFEMIKDEKKVDPRSINN